MLQYLSGTLYLKHFNHFSDILKVEEDEVLELLVKDTLYEAWTVSGHNNILSSGGLHERVYRLVAYESNIVHITQIGRRLKIILETGEVHTPYVTDL